MECFLKEIQKTNQTDVRGRKVKKREKVINYLPKVKVLITPLKLYW